MARRTNRRRRRRGRYGFLYKLLSVLVICAAIVAALTLFFKVNTIVVSGQSHYTEQAILDAAQVQYGDNMYLLNKHSVANRIMQQCPYVENARINRKLPDTLLIEITETTAAGVIVQDGVGWLISPKGKVLEKLAAGQAGDYAVIDGCTLLAPAVSSFLSFGEEESYKQEQLLALLGALREAEVLDQVEAVHLGDASVLTMEYGGRFTVKLAWGANFAYQIQNLEYVISCLEINETGTIDLTREGVANFIP